jgi:hypothetical protein
MNLNDERKDILDKLAKASDIIKDKKGLIKQLAKNIEKSLDTQYIKVLASNAGIDNPEKKDISALIKRLKDSHFPTFSDRYVSECLSEEYKRDYAGRVEDTSKVIRWNVSNDDQREQMEQEIKDYKKSNSPAKAIITKARKEDMEKYTWKCHTANELALLAIKMEEDHEEKHQDVLCKEYAKRAKMVRDSRFATDANSYEAIILACNSTQSLKNSIKGEWEFKTVWEIKEDEKKCRECILDQCEKERCRHECHRVVRPMTTKGLKYAIKTNEDLSNLDQHIKRLETLNNDICRIGKMLIENPKSKKLLGATAIKRLIYSHIEKDECLNCDMFLEKHVDFFDTFK